MKYEYVNKNIFVPTTSCATTQASFSGVRLNQHPRDPLSQRPDWSKEPQKETDEEMEKRLWEALCAILCRSEVIPVLLYTTDKEPEWRDMVAGCGYAKLAIETKTQHQPRDYNVQLWVFEEHAPDRAN